MYKIPVEGLGIYHPTSHHKAYKTSSVKSRDIMSVQQGGRNVISECEQLCQLQIQCIELHRILPYGKMISMHCTTHTVGMHGKLDSSGASGMLEHWWRVGIIVDTRMLAILG